MSFHWPDERAPEHPLVAALARMAQCQEKTERAWRDLTTELLVLRSELAEARALLLEIKRHDAERDARACADVGDKCLKLLALGIL